MRNEGLIQDLEAQAAQLRMERERALKTQAARVAEMDEAKQEVQQIERQLTAIDAVIRSMTEDV